jgi:hypothetical protein
MIVCTHFIRVSPTYTAYLPILKLHTTYILHIFFLVIFQLVLYVFNLLIFIYCILIHYCISVYIV